MNNKDGDILVCCIDPAVGITRNKIYEYKKSLNRGLNFGELDMTYLINDRGVLQSYYSLRFRELKEVREQQIDKLLNVL